MAKQFIEVRLGLNGGYETERMGGKAIVYESGEARLLALGCPQSVLTEIRELRSGVRKTPSRVVAPVRSDRSAYVNQIIDESNRRRARQLTEQIDAGNRRRCAELAKII